MQEKREIWYKIIHFYKKNSAITYPIHPYGAIFSSKPTSNKYMANVSFVCLVFLDCLPYHSLLSQDYWKMVQGSICPVVTILTITALQRKCTKKHKKVAFQVIDLPLFSPYIWRGICKTRTNKKI